MGEVIAGLALFVSDFWGVHEAEEARIKCY